jgi:hypothetical protein
MHRVEDEGRIFLKKLIKRPATKSGFPYTLITNTGILL